MKTSSILLALQLKLLATLGALLVTLILAGCVASIPINAAEPFSNKLFEFLDQDWVGRPDVVKWLGEPDTTRQEGELAFYIAPREMSRNLQATPSFVEYHYLLIAYDANGKVAYHRRFINALCAPLKRCDSTTTPFPDGTPPATPIALPVFGDAGLAERKSAAVNQLVVYADPVLDQSVKAFEPAPDACTLIIYHDAELPMVKISIGSGRDDLMLTKDGYMSWISQPGQQSVRVSWSNWKGEFSSRTINIGCEAGALLFQKLEFQRTKYWGWQFEMEIHQVSTEAGKEDVHARWLVLQ